MRPIRVPITPPDLAAVAKDITRLASPAPEHLAGLFPGVQTSMFSSLAFSVWIYGEATKASWRREASQSLLSIAASAFVPHILKRVFKQTRPDRLTVNDS